MTDLTVQLNRLCLPNPILVASGTFGYAREMAAFTDFSIDHFDVLDDLSLITGTRQRVLAA